MRLRRVEPTVITCFLFKLNKQTNSIYIKLCLRMFKGFRNIVGLYFFICTIFILHLKEQIQQLMNDSVSFPFLSGILEQYRTLHTGTSYYSQ